MNDHFSYLQNLSFKFFYTSLHLKWIFFSLIIGNNTLYVFYWLLEYVVFLDISLNSKGLAIVSCYLSFFAYYEFYFSIDCTLIKVLVLFLGSETSVRPLKPFRAPEFVFGLHSSLESV
jgi:hypothetical protein